MIAAIAILVARKEPMMQVRQRIIAIMIAGAVLLSLPYLVIGNDKQILTVNETVGAAFVRPGTEKDSRHALFKRANPEAKDAIYRVLRNDDLREFHSAAIQILGYMGNSDDAEYLESLVRDGYEGVLDGERRDAVRAIFAALGIMHGRGVERAGQVLDRMLKTEYWEQVDFLWRSKDISAGPGFAYESIAWALQGYAMSGKVEVAEKAGSVLADIDDPELKRYMEWRIDPDRLRASAEANRRVADQPISSQQREEAVRCFNGDLQNPGPVGESADAVGAHEVQDQEADRDISRGRRRAAESDGSTDQALNGTDIGAVTDLSADAMAQYEHIRGMVARGEFEAVADRLLDDGKPLDVAKARESPEFRQAIAMEQRIFASLDQVQTTPSKFRIERHAQYAFDSFPDGGGPENVRMRETVLLTFVLKGSHEVEQKLFQTHRGTRTVADDGTLIVVMKKIDAKWYWNPFGW